MNFWTTTSYLSTNPYKQQRSGLLYWYDLCDGIAILFFITFQPWYNSASVTWNHKKKLSQRLFHNLWRPDTVIKFEVPVFGEVRFGRQSPATIPDAGYYIQVCRIHFGWSNFHQNSLLQPNKCPWGKAGKTFDSFHNFFEIITLLGPNVESLACIYSTFVTPIPQFLVLEQRGTYYLVWLHWSLLYLLLVWFCLQDI